MLKKIYLIGRAGSGKTAVAMGLSLLWREKGLNIAYFKPKRTGKDLQRKHDADALLFKHVLDLPWEPEQISPLNFYPTYIFDPPQNIRPAVEKAAEAVEKGFAAIAGHNGEVMVIEGSRSPSAGLSFGLDDFSLAKKWAAPILFVANLEKDDDLDEILFYNNFMQAAGLRIIGNVFNNVPQPILDKVRNTYRPLLEEKGCIVRGIIPAHPKVTFPTVAEFYEALKGEILYGEENMSRPVEEIVVGTMTVEGALRFLHRALNKAVITGGDRSDMALTALETSTAVLILTGGLRPDVRVIARAQEKGVPVILVPHDTFTTIGALQNVVRQIHPQDRETIALVKDEVARYCAWEEIFKELGSVAGQPDALSVDSRQQA